MKRVISFCLFLFFPLYLHCYDDEYLAEYVRRGILESAGLSFRTCEGSDDFIAKFQLNEEEISMIGAWAFDGVVCPIPRNREYGPGLSIRFYPNRLFRIYKENEDNGQIKQIVGEWKVNDGKLQVMFIAKIMIRDSTSKDKDAKYDVVYLTDATFYTIFSVPVYTIAYVNSEPFDWSELPLNLLLSLDFTNNDAPRSRIFIETLGDPDGNVSIGTYRGDLLFSPRINSREYLIDLTGAW